MSKIVKSSQDIVLFGRQKELKLAILQSMANQRIIWSKDVGQIVGLPAADAISAKPQERKLIIAFKETKDGKTRINGRLAKLVAYTIPEPKKALTYTQIKTVTQPFTWGPWRATAFFNNRRQMAVYGVSKQECEKVLLKLATLSTASITKLHISEEKISNPKLKKIPTRVFPAYATLVSEPTDIQGKPLQGDKAYKKQRRRLILYRDPVNNLPLG
ncbi:MAG: hypothetical protein QNJ36_03200 [Calothrix sp. MO_167.B42]|nr:hypothetical protein [Calothrix sp. MO_167.B42]